MSVKKDKKALLETILGSEITIPSKTTKVSEMINRENILEIVSSDLHSSLSDFFDALAPIFTTSLPLEAIIKYKDGNYSAPSKG